MNEKRFQQNGPVPPPPQKYVDQTRRPPTPPTPPHPAGQGSPPPPPGNPPPPPGPGDAHNLYRQPPAQPQVSTLDGIEIAVLAVMGLALPVLYLIAGARTGEWAFMFVLGLVVYVGAFIASWIGMNPLSGLIGSDASWAAFAVVLVWLMFAVVGDPSATP